MIYDVYMIKLMFLYNRDKIIKNLLLNELDEIKIKSNYHIKWIKSNWNVILFNKLNSL